MDFYKRVGIVCRSIPYGKVGNLWTGRSALPKPKNSRHVGFALNKGMSGFGLPAHRVVNHQGYLSEPVHFPRPDTQQATSEFEGCSCGFG